MLNKSWSKFLSCYDRNLSCQPYQKQYKQNVCSLLDM